MPGEKATQKDRILKLTTPLGEDFLLIESFGGREGISSLFSFHMDLLHQDDSTTPHVVEPTDILGKAVTIELVQRGGTTRHFHGMVNRFTQGGRDGEFTSYRMEVVPQLWLLTQSRQSRIFQNKNVPDILKEVLNGLNIKIDIRRRYQPRNYCVQYRESDFDFASRLMEEEGIFYYFEHTADAHTMIIGDDMQCHKDCKSKSSIDFVLKNTGALLVPVVNEWTLNYELHTGKFQFWDHHFQLPYKKLEAPEPSIFNKVNNQAVEFYDFPGGYAKKFDGVDRGGGAQEDNLKKVFDDNKRVALNARDAVDVKFKTFRGTSDCASFTAGHKFEIKNLPITNQDGKYALTSVEHVCRQTPSYRSGFENDAPYMNRFACIRLGQDDSVTFRPQQITPKPVIQGSQTGYVVGPSGEEIFTDKYGRVKVQLHWDRQGQMDAGSSCWMRVAQAWAGKGWGMVNIPRIGTEVMVHFLEGDPDQPIVAGCLYNAESMPPDELPANKTRAHVKSNSSPGGSGYNGIRFEDKKGEEQFFIHAEKDLETRVKHDSISYVENEQHMIVVSDVLTKTSGDIHNDTSGNKIEKLGGSHSSTVGGSVDQKVGQKHALESGMEIHLKAGMKVVIEAGAQLSLKGPGGFIDIGPTGVTIQGTMVLINSGGAAGSGSGASPGSPKTPKEAAKAGSGQKLSRPPTKPAYQSPGATALSGAAASGQPLANTGGAASGEPGAGGGKGGGMADSGKGGMEQAGKGGMEDAGKGGKGDGGKGGVDESGKGGMEQAGKGGMEDAGKGGKGDGGKGGVDESGKGGMEQAGKGGMEDAGKGGKGDGGKGGVDESGKGGMEDAGKGGKGDGGKGGFDESGKGGIDDGSGKGGGTGDGGKGGGGSIW